MFARKKRILFMATLVFLFMFALVSTATACTTVNWTIKYNGQEIPGKHVWSAGDPQPVYEFQVPLQDGTNGRKIVVHYQLNLKSNTLFPELQPVPRPDPQPVPEPQKPKPQPVPETWRPRPQPVPEPWRPQPQPVPEPWRPQPQPVPEPWRPQPQPVPDPQLPQPDPAPEPQLPDPQPDPVPQPGEISLTADELQLFQLVNQERRQAGLPELKIHAGLTELARLKSKDMINLNYFAHQSPTYGSPFDMMRQAGIAYYYAGENLAGSPTVDRAHTALMNSPGHRANILNANYTHIGIGIIDGGPYGKMYTQMFIQAR